MRFAPSAELRSFADALDALLTSADTPGATRRWAEGEPADGLRLWTRLAELGVMGLRQEGGEPLDLAVACERLGYHGVPGPYIESLALAPALLTGEILADLAKGAARVTVAYPYALDADTATHIYVLDGRALARGRVTRMLESIDPARRLAVVETTETLGEVDPERALDEATLACAAWLVGAGQRLLDDTVAYVLARRQFGRAIGEFQAVKHALADVRVGLDLARPLVWGAARGLDPRDVSAAKVMAAEAGNRAARTALQLHGAIGYTRELDLSLWLLRVRALIGAWGTPDQHRARLLGA
jgi:alkylation response protein AidB-like acyl-CoA dehydrogenase